MSKVRERKRRQLGLSKKDLMVCDYCLDPVEYAKSMIASNGKVACYACLETIEGPTEFCSFECIATGNCDGEC